MLMGTQVLKKNFPGRNSFSVFLIIRSPIGAWDRLAIPKTPFSKFPIRPSRLRVPSGKTNRFPPAAKYACISRICFIMRCFPLPCAVEGKYPECLINQPNNGTLKKRFLTIVFCFSNNEIRYNGSRYDTWLQMTMEDRILRISSGMLTVKPGDITRLINRKDLKNRWFNFWNDSSLSLEIKNEMR